MSDSDRREMDWAMAGARRSVRPIDRDLLETDRRLADGRGHADRPAWQPPAGAAARDGEVPAAFGAHRRQVRRGHRVLPLWPVDFAQRGRDPSRPSSRSRPPVSIMPCASAASAFPQALLATATHDHKRGEDTRARLAVISEIPEEWEAALTRWTRLNALAKRDLDGPAPDACDEIMLYESIVGAWPLGLSPDDREGMMALEERLAAWQEKALREGKRHGLAGPCRTRITRRPAGTSWRRRSTRSGRPEWCRTLPRSSSGSPGGRRERAVPGHAEAHVARRAGPVSRDGVLGFQPGRPGQPPPGGFRRPRGLAWRKPSRQPRCCPIGATAG